MSTDGRDRLSSHHLHLLKETKCTKFFYSEERSARVLEIQGLLPSLAVFQIPSLKTILDDEAGLRSYPCHQDYADVEDQVACIIHSSGTTGKFALHANLYPISPIPGLPKPVPLTNGFMATVDAMVRLHLPEGRVPACFFHLSTPHRVLSTTPFFHLMGLISFVISIFHSVPVVIGPDKPLSVEHPVGLMKLTRITAALFPPYWRT